MDLGRSIHYFREQGSTDPLGPHVYRRWHS